MTALYLIESLMEFACLLAAIVLLLIARSPGESSVVTSRHLKRKKYIGFAIVFILLTMMCNYGYIIFRYFNPPNPWEFIEPYPISPESNCVKVIK